MLGEILLVIGASLAIVAVATVMMVVVDKCPDEFKDEINDAR